MNGNQFTPRMICILLLTGTFLIYWQGIHNEFINFDDNEYVTENRQLQSGLTLESISWAFTTSNFVNWHPITWMSHMLDFQLYGLNPAGHHFTSLLIHATNVLLLFIVLNRITRDPWKCAVVSALFAFHPLNVESVAWIAERKNVLSTLFWLLTIWAYVLFVEHRVCSPHAGKACRSPLTRRLAEASSARNQPRPVPNDRLTKASTLALHPQHLFHLRSHRGVD